VNGLDFGSFSETFGDDEDIVGSVLSYWEKSHKIHAYSVKDFHHIDEIEFTVSCYRFSFLINFAGLDKIFDILIHVVLIVVFSNLEVDDINSSIVTVGVLIKVDKERFFFEISDYMKRIFSVESMKFE